MNSRGMLYDLVIEALVRVRLATERAEVALARRRNGIVGASWEWGGTVDLDWAEQRARLATDNGRAETPRKPHQNGSTPPPGEQT